MTGDRRGHRPIVSPHRVRRSRRAARPGAPIQRVARYPSAEPLAAPVPGLPFHPARACADGGPGGSWPVAVATACLCTPRMPTPPRHEPHRSVAADLRREGDRELWNGVAVAMSPSPLRPARAGHRQARVSDRAMPAGAGLRVRHIRGTRLDRERRDRGASRCDGGLRHPAEATPRATAGPGDRDSRRRDGRNGPQRETRPR